MPPVVENPACRQCGGLSDSGARRRRRGRLDAASEMTLALPETIKRPVSSAATLAAIMAGLDLTSKWLIVSFFGFETGRAVAVLPFLDFTLIWNSGISYGLFSEQGETGRYVLIGATVLVINVAGQCEVLKRGWAWPGYGLILGGALGNLVDRLAHGAVMNFISLHAAGLLSHVFNLADVWICLGVAVLLLDFWKNRANNQMSSAPFAGRQISAIEVKRFVERTKR